MTALTTACADDKQMTASDSDGSTSGTPTTGSSMGTTGPTSGPTSGPGTGSTSEATTTPTTTEGKMDMAVGAMCSPSAQDCPDGQKCTAYESMLGDPPGWDADKCVQDPLNGGKVGDPCQIDEGESVFSGLDNCGAGYFCFNFDFSTGKGGACIEFCKEDGTCPETNGGNAGCVEGANMGVLPICLGKCDPLIQDCADGEGCYGDQSLPFFICATPDTGMGTGTDNEPCEFTNACAPGFSCTAAAAVEGCDPMAMGCCSPFCSVSGGDAGCAPSEDCLPFYASDPPPGLEDVGVCAIPQ